MLVFAESDSAYGRKQKINSKDHFLIFMQKLCPLQTNLSKYSESPAAISTVCLRILLRISILQAQSSN
jgi:hypothetical protein